MAAVSRAFCQTPGRAGMCIGVLPSRSDYPNYRPKAGYPNEWVESCDPDASAQKRQGREVDTVAEPHQRAGVGRDHHAAGKPRHTE